MATCLANIERFHINKFDKHFDQIGKIDWKKKIESKKLTTEYGLYRLLQDGQDCMPVCSGDETAHCISQCRQK